MDTLVENNDLLSIINDSKTEAHEDTHKPEIKQMKYVKSQISPEKGTSPQKFGSDTRLFLGNQNEELTSTVPQKPRKSQPENQETNTEKNSQEQWR